MTKQFPKTKGGVALLLDVPIKLLNYVLYGLCAEEKYETFSIPKKNGGERIIEAPKMALKSLQKRLSDCLYERAPMKSCVYAFCRGKSKGIKGNADVHKNKRWIVSIDLKDFFRSINFGRVRGLFLSPPFNCTEETATVFAQLACFDNHLAQGAPSSPIISNLICRRLDNELMRFAKDNHLFYTRYADDITFSSNERSVPDKLGSVVDGHFALSDAIFEIVETENGFIINRDKVHYSTKCDRQMVTGLVVNKKVNIQRRYVRQVRAMLHAWKRYGKTEAAKEHFSRYKRKNVSNVDDSFSREIQGRINFIGDIRGKDDSLYFHLCHMLWELEPKASLKVSYSSASYDAVVFCEGPSDGLHLAAALDYLKRNGEYLDLNVFFYKYSKKQSISNSKLKDLLNYRVTWVDDPKVVEIYLFDRDDMQYLNMESESGAPICHSKNRFSFLLPCVEHRVSHRVCIEHFYKNADLLKKDKNGRRIYLSTEFERETAYCAKEKVSTTRKKTLRCDYEFIIDSGVLDEYENNVALSKMAFAQDVFNKVPPFDQMDFSSFSAIFDKIRLVITMAKEPVDVEL